MPTPEGVTFHKGRFVAQVSMGSDPVTGKRRRRQYTAPPCDKHTATGTDAACQACQFVARDLRAEKLTEARGVHYVPSDEVTLAEFLDRFLVAHAARRRKSTLLGYRAKVANVINPRIGHVPVQKLTGAQLEEFYARLYVGDELYPRGYALASIRQVHAILRRALRDAVMPRGNLLTFNPADNLELPADDDSEDAVAVLHTWTVSQLRTFLAAARSSEHGAFFYVAAITGMRRSEVCGLRWDMVDLDRGLIRVERTRHRIDGEVVWSKPKSKRSRRTIELSDTQTRVLRDHRRSQAERRLAAGSGWEDTDLVFTDEGGNGYPPDTYTAAFHRLVLSLDVPTIRLHDLRHTHATLLLEQGRPVKEVSERLGHSSTSFTMDTYMHVTPEMKSRTAEALDEILGG